MQLSCCVVVATLIACFLPWIFLLLSLGGLFASHNQSDELVIIEPEQTIVSDDQAPEGAVTVQCSPVSSLHALVIGIDVYLNQPHLAGAVHDANKIRHFLVNDLGTPPSHITYLCNEAATRESIISAFRKLQDNNGIQESPILIYFAGHGGLVEPSREQTQWHGSASKIQVIFPHDYGKEFVGKDGSKEKVNCIPDWTIAGLLNNLAKARGDNITVIFDSCHSASGSRVLSTGGGRRARAAKVMFEIPTDIDKDVLAYTPSATGAAPRYLGSPFSAHQKSHIHLAACGSNEHAWEEDGHGEFTEAFLKTIRAHGIDKVTYRNFIMGLPYLAKQTPHCYGAHRDRLFFDGHVPSRKVVYVPVIYDPIEKSLTLQAGVASGVTHESVWELRQYAILGDEGILGKIMAHHPGISTTKMQAENAEDAEFWKHCESGTLYENKKLKLYARLVRSGLGNELKVWFSPEAKKLILPKLEDGNPQFSSEVSHEFGYVAHTAQDSADMVVRIYEPKETPPSRAPTTSNESSAVPEVEFVLCNVYATKYGISTLPQRKPARRKEVETILFAAARWHWYLRHTNGEHPKDEHTNDKHTNDKHTRTLVEMDIFKIAERSRVNGRYSDTRWRQLKADKRGSYMNQTGVVDFDVRGEDLYGVRLKSEVKRPLYVRMFYFDMRTFCINDQFGHTVANGKADADILSQGEFIIGDDAEGGTPLPFELEPDDTIDVGCMKVFWSTDPLELDGLRQDSAFEMKPGRQGRKVGVLRQKDEKSDWGTTSMILVQRRPRDNV